MKQDITKYVGEQIKKYRLQKRMTQKELGLKIGVKHNTVSSYESGTNEPEQDIMFKIAEALDLNINDLFPSTKDRYVPVGIDIIMLPVVGRISCGDGVLTFEDIEGYEPTPKEWLTSGEYFYLRAKGDSMTGARIYDGDLLLIRQQAEVENGEIAAVIINDGAVLKKVYINGDQLVLHSENPAYSPIFCPGAEARIIGKLKMNVINY